MFFSLMLNVPSTEYTQRRFLAPGSGLGLVVSHQQLLFEQPGFTSKQKNGNHWKSYMVIYENIKAILESATEVYGNIQVIHCTIGWP